MKKNIYFLLMCTLFAWSCKKDADEVPKGANGEVLEIFSPGDVTNGSATGTKTIGNGQKGIVTVGGAGLLYSTITNGTFIISVGSKTEFNELREAISIEDIPMRKGNFFIDEPNYINNDGKISASYGRLIADGCVSDATHLFDLEKKNNVTVTEIDTIAKTVKGIFNVHFKLIEAGSIPNLPKQVSFTNMKFDLKLIKI